MKTIFRMLMAILCVTLATPVMAAQTGSASKIKPGVKPAKPIKSKTAESEIRAVLDAQVESWNAGKLEEFMEGYWRSPELTFFSGGRKLTSWDATLERYRKTYQAEGKEMGKLAFSDLDIQSLGESSSVVRGRWKLRMSDGKEIGGLYTLIFRRFKDGWKIVHDHTSSN
jgi:beta-aspartyl-peptidase (threonine type)